MDFGHRGPAAQPGRKLIERRWRAGRQNLDPTILQIPCPAIDTESQRLPCRAGAKPHTLNTTGNEEPPGSDAPGHRPITAQSRPNYGNRPLAASFALRLTSSASKATSFDRTAALRACQ